jgi:hypothetical protein
MTCAFHLKGLVEPTWWAWLPCTVPPPNYALQHFAERFEPLFGQSVTKSVWRCTGASGQCLFDVRSVRSASNLDFVCSTAASQG